MTVAVAVDAPGGEMARAAGSTPTVERGRGAARPGWEWGAVAALLLATGLLYLWGLSGSGWANSYYSAAVQAGTRSWKAFLFGSLDGASFITVDKAPAFLWPMELSARIFGLSSWSILVPQALEGVATVAILYAAVRRWFGAAAGLLAGAVFALTPVAALIFRYNNPDALLALLLTAAAYGMTRALERGSGRWLAFAFALVGVGFLAKMLQTLLVVPPFVLVYLAAAPTSLGRRVRQLAVATVAMLVSAGWWVALVVLWPAASRPYVGGSQDNSLWNLIFGYNGFGRLTGNEAGSVGGGFQSGSRWGPTGLTRLFNASFGGQISWLLPAALVLLVAGLVVTWRTPRTGRTRAALALWGGCLLMTALAFSLGHGIIHPYYTVALAAPLAVVVAIGAVTLFRRRTLAGWYVLVGAFAATVAWSAHLLDRTPAWHPALRTLVVVGGVVVTAGLVLWPLTGRRPARLLVAAALVVAVAGSAAFSLATVSSAHTGAIPSAGPAGVGPGGPGPGGAGGPGPATGGPRGGPGGLLDGTAVSATLRSYLTDRSADVTWVAATVGANDAASYQLATGRAVLAIGGFNGTDPAPTLAEFRRDVAAHRIAFFIGGGVTGGPSPASTTAQQITTWVEEHYTARTVAGVTVYPLFTTSAP